MNNTLSLTFTDEQLAILKHHVRTSVREHHNEDCLFCGYRLCLDIHPALGLSVELHLDGMMIELGDVATNL